MICTLAVFKLGVLVVGLSVADVPAEMCKSWSDQWSSIGYAVRREWHKPERR